MKVALLTNAKKMSSATRIKSALLETGVVTYCRIIEGPPNLDFSPFDLIISYYYKYILSADQLKSVFYRGINIHPSLLPEGRGANPNVWTIIAGMPTTGVTIHWMEPTVDSGNILQQTYVPVYPQDSGDDLYIRLSTAAEKLALTYLPLFIQGLMNGYVPRGTAQGDPIYSPKRGWRKSDLPQIQDLEYEFTHSEFQVVKHAINIMRACTFLGYGGAYIRDKNGRKLSISLRLRPMMED